MPMAARTVTDDPLLSAVCRAYDEIAAERDVPQDAILTASAVRAVERHGVTEAQLAELGATPDRVLASIQRRGSPPGCAAFVTYLQSLPPPH